MFKASAQLSAEQAKRDAVLAFRQEIGAELTKLLAQDTHKALDDKALAALHSLGQEAGVIGEIVSGEEKVALC